MSNIGEPEQHNIYQLNYFHKNPRIGDIIILDPVTGWHVMDSETFAQTYEEVIND